MPAHSVLMIEPGNFYSNPETASDNFFQHHSVINQADEIHAAALQEFQVLAHKLKAEGIEVTAYRPDDGLPTPDAAFPNNWFSTHPDGTLVLYPMMAKNRRLERRPAILEPLRKNYSGFIDLSSYENKNLFLEGTGSLVIDHQNRLAYASISKRTAVDVLHAWSTQMKHQLVTFTSLDANLQVIYHTNVMMCLGLGFAIVCMEAIHDVTEKNLVRSTLISTNHEVIEISSDQMHHFCGNCLALENKSGRQLLVMSDEAFQHFRNDQLKTIQKFCSIIHSDLHTLETFGGGGARCMMAELY